MGIEVVGRHALLFDDDGMATFVNSNDALVEWNSIPIDRYDVRHLLSSPPPSRRRRNPQQLIYSPDSVEAELDYERYLDLPSEQQEPDDGLKTIDAGPAGGYNAVAFSYGNIDNSTDQKNSEAGLGSPGFCPPFPVPENLVVPLTEKLHQIIARTATFVSKHGGQSEIVLRVKQGDNPTFGFLMPDHHLHSYFRFLVDHREVLDSDAEGKPQSEDKTSNAEADGGAGALSLLGSIYGSGEEEEDAAEHTLPSKENGPAEAVNASKTVSHESEKTVSPKVTSVKDESVPKHLILPNDKVPVVKRNSFGSGLKAGSSSGTRKESESSVLVATATNKVRASSVPAISKIEPLLLEPPSEIKNLVNKIVEFILKNGKKYEAVLIEQDSENRRFPFLLPSNPYNPYFLKVLQEAQESEVSGKSSYKDKHGLAGHVPDKKSLESAGCDIPYDSERKEKFKMVIGKSKKDGEDPPKTTQQQQIGVGVDAAAAAAILQAATRGIRNPNLGFLPKSSLNNGNSHDHSTEGQSQSAFKKSDHNREPVAKATAKTTALEVESEADSREAHLTKEQKLKAERLRRAKMFVAMIKSGSAPPKPEHTRGLSVEPKESNVVGAGNSAAKERVCSSAPLEIDISEKNETSEKKHSDDDEYNERRAKRKYRSRSSKQEAEGEDDDDENELVQKHSRKKHHSHRSLRDGENKDEERDSKHSRKKHRSHHSSHASDEREDDDDDDRDRKYSRKKHHRSHRSLHEDEEEEEHDDHRQSRKKHQSHHSSHHSRDGHNKHRKRHSSSKDRENQHRHKHDISSDEDRSRSWNKKHSKGSESEEGLEEGELSSKASSDQSKGSVDGVGARREASVDVASSSNQDEKASSQPGAQPKPTEVPDDLRAKIRAMLMGNL